MKFKALISILLLTLVAYAQQPVNPVNTQQISMPVLATIPLPAQSANVQLSGNPGPRAIFYWVVAKYPVGDATLAGPFTITNAPNTLSASDFVQISTVLPSGATFYDLLKTNTTVPPSGACACAVATSVAVGTVTNDQSNSTGAYTVNPFDISTLGLTLQNEVQSLGVSHLILRQKGAFVVDLSAAGAGGVTSVFGRVGAVTAQSGDYTAAQVTNAVDKTAANTAGAGFTLDASAASALTGLKVPTSAGAAPTAGGALAYDSTANQPVYGDGAATKKVIPLIGSTPTTGNCMKASVTGTQVGVQDAGYVCVSPSNVLTQVTQTGLLAEYQMPPTETSTTVLTDYSGNGNNGTFPGGAANPTRNSYGGISCAAASSQNIALPSALNGAKTWMFVTFLDPNATGLTNRANFLSPAAGNGPAIYFSNSSGTVIGWPPPNSLLGTGVWGVRGFNSANVLAGSDVLPSHGWQIITWSETAGSDTIYHYFTTESGSATSLGTLPAGNYQLCGGTAAGGHYFQGQILYAAAWSIALNRSQVEESVQAVQHIIAANDGLVLNAIPGGGTWQNPTSIVDNSTLMFYGDSITGNLVTPNFPTLSGKFTNIFVGGFAGTFAGQQSIRAPYLVDALLPNVGNGAPILPTPGTASGMSATKSAIIINLGTNTNSDGAVIGELAEICQRRHLAGWNKVAVTTVLSNWFGGNHDTIKNSQNPSNRQLWPQFADVLLDWAAIPALGADGAFQNSSYTTSGIHPDTTISQQMAGQAYSYAARRLYGNPLTGTPNVAVASPYLVQPEDIFFETNTAGPISAYLIPAQFFTGQTVTVKNLGAGALTLNPKPVSATITNLALTTNVITITAVNNYTAGDVVILTGLTTNPTLNGTSIIISATGLSATAFQAPLTHANIGSAAETGTATMAIYAQIAAITNVSESAGNVVTLTASNNYANGSSITISGVTTATWLNGQTVTLTSANSTTLQFTDGTAHGAYGPAADTGTTLFTYAAETFNGAPSLTVASGATAVLLSVFTSNATGGANWITLQNN